MFRVDQMQLFRVTVGLGLASLVVFAEAAAGSVWQVAAWFVPQVLALGLWSARVGTSSGPARGLMLLMLVGQFTYFGAGFVWFLWPVVLGYALPFPSPVDALFFVSYAIFALFLMRLYRSYRTDPVDDRFALIDSLILTTTVSAVLWVELIAPQLRNDTPALTVTVAVLYTSFTLLLFALAARTAISLRLTKSAPALLMLVWIGGKAAADIFYGFQGANGTFTYDGPLMLLWFASYVGLAALGAHPALEKFLAGDEDARATRGSQARQESLRARNLRLGVLLLAALAPLPLHAVYHDNSPSLLVASGAAFILITYRTSLLTGDLGSQRQLAGELDQAVHRLRTQRDELARYAAIVASTDDAVVIISLEGLIIDWNRGAEGLYGYPREEVLGRPITLLSAPGYAEGIQSTIAYVADHGHASVETVDRRKDGSTVQTSATISNVYDQAGNVIALVGISRDISDRKARDAEIHEASKLESLGRLSAGLAHEINSPIQYVGDNARFLEEAYQELIAVVSFYRGLLDTSNPIGWAERQERVREAEAKIDFDYLQKEIPSAVEQTLAGIERVSKIVRAMKTFSHPGHEEQVPANLNEALEATITVTRHQVSSVADLRLDLSELPPVRCNIAELNQVFLNLIVNAADAIGETGNPGLIVVSTRVDADHVVIRISDTGGGIPDDVRPKIFDPFFTTKEVGYGSGQGLPLARGVVHEGHGGTLTVESTLGVGSTFTIRLPIAGREAAELVGASA